MNAQEISEEVLETKMRCAERFLEKCGAVPLDNNQRNREVLQQRRTYQYKNDYYRIDHAVFDGRQFLIVSSTDVEKYAAIGLLEDVDAIPAEASESEIERGIKRALKLSDQ